MFVTEGMCFQKFAHVFSCICVSSIGVAFSDW